ncbi:MAG: 2-amino-4-hydroxy-6-hydroxymethyldihydropteridine diphosphokinase [Elusimicrobia bacterium]|nr:2-amino-4-hydroxy-6-hydroxymethyldihydropteridine diphosphokinase [Elusimicrobiota bacterium]
MARQNSSHIAFVAFGSNLGRRRSTVERALRALAKEPGVTLRRVSRLYETEPVGGPAGQNAFLNGVVELGVTLAPRALLSRLQRIETRFGRRRRSEPLWGPRTLDLDLLAFDARRERFRDLVLPHPRYHERRFVLRPFCDLAPRFRHPGLKTENRLLMRRLPRSGQRVTMVGTWKDTRFSPSRKRKPTARPSSS